MRRSLRYEARMAAMRAQAEKDRAAFEAIRAKMRAKGHVVYEPHRCGWLPAVGEFRPGTIWECEHGAQWELVEENQWLSWREVRAPVEAS